MDFNKYQRFLRNIDYGRSISNQHFNQCFSKPEKIDQCEMDAEIKVIEHLTQLYDIESELKKGKSISDYDKRITYSEGSFFWSDSKVCRAIREVLGVIKPSPEPYWIEVDTLEDNIPTYSQFMDYEAGMIAQRKGVNYQCVIDNGYSFDNIRVPYPADVIHYSSMQSEQFIPGAPYEVGTFVNENDRFYLLKTLEGYDPGISPAKLSCFTPIQEHSNDSIYTIGDYVSYQGYVYKVMMNVNPDVPTLRTNIVNHDPRNYNLIKYLVEISLYYAYKEFSPNNVSQARVNSYNEAEKWLCDAAKLRIDPQLARRTDKKGDETQPFVMGKFVNESSYVNNQWAL